MNIRVFLADDHPIVRDGLRFAIQRSGSGIQVVGEASNGQELLDLSTDTHVDVFITDVSMPVLNGIEATRLLLRRQPSARVVILSFLNSDMIVGGALRAGARGFLTKETATRCVVDAIKEVYSGRYYISPDVSRCILQGFLGASATKDAPMGPAVLTSQERRVLQLIAEGKTSKDIAVVLGVSANTVHRHRSNLMKKLDIHRQADLVRFALREGIAKA